MARGRSTPWGHEVTVVYCWASSDLARATQWPNGGKSEACRSMEALTSKRGGVYPV